MSKIFSMQSAKQSHRAIRLCGMLIAFAAAIFLFNAPAKAQQQRQNVPTNRPMMPRIDPFDMPPMYGGDPLRRRADAKRLQYLNTERQKSLVAETNRLVKLATELHAQINGEQSGPLTPDQIRQFQEIEKLAHNIRVKMSTSVRPAPSFDSGPPFISPR